MQTIQFKCPTCKYANLSIGSTSMIQTADSNYVEIILNCPMCKKPTEIRVQQANQSKLSKIFIGSYPSPPSICDKCIHDFGNCGSDYIKWGSGFIKRDEKLHLVHDFVFECIGFESDDIDEKIITLNLHL